MNTEKLGVLIVTTTGHRRFLKACIESCRKMNPAVIVCSLEVTLDSGLNSQPNLILPAYDVLCMVDMWFFGKFYNTVGSWPWVQRHGLSMLEKYRNHRIRKDGEVVIQEKEYFESEIDYVFSIEGDCIVDRPEGIHEIFDMLIDNDADTINAECKGEKYAGALSYFAKKEAALKINQHIIDNLHNNFGNVEGRMGKAISMQNLKCVPVRNPDHEQFSYGDRGTWGDILGFRHLHGEEKWRKSNHVKPFKKEYYDVRYLMDHEKKALSIYWETGRTDHFIETTFWNPKKEELGEN